jgi:hypothetical protein
MPIFFQWQGSLCRAQGRHVARGQAFIAPWLHFNFAVFESNCDRFYDCRIAAINVCASLPIIFGGLRNMRAPDGFPRQ